MGTAVCETVTSQRGGLVEDEEVAVGLEGGTLV